MNFILRERNVMQIAKTIKDLILGILISAGIIIILLGIQAIGRSSDKWYLYFIVGIVVVASSIFVASKIRT